MVQLDVPDANTMSWRAIVGTGPCPAQSVGPGTQALTGTILHRMLPLSIDIVPLIQNGISESVIENRSSETLSGGSRCALHQPANT